VKVSNLLSDCSFSLKYLNTLMMCKWEESATIKHNKKIEWIIIGVVVSVLVLLIALTN
jgi:uncharacterized Rmd1/YagE family protein